ncbi:MAG: hypothetical protein IJ894_00995, partial [Bacteroidales bacterium]|nr:hypothetical protein [Bacteroidales bacterium]
MHKNGHVKLWTATANLKYDANQAFYFVADDGNGGGGHTYGNILEEDFCIGMNMRGVRQQSAEEIAQAKAAAEKAEAERKLFEPIVNNYRNLDKLEKQYKSEMENDLELYKAAF